MSKPNQDQIDEVLNTCAESTDSGESQYPGMTYEEGVDAAIRWMQGDGDHPFEQ